MGVRSCGPFCVAGGVPGNSIPYSCPAYDINVPSDCQECPYSSANTGILLESSVVTEKEGFEPSVRENHGGKR